MHHLIFAVLILFSTVENSHLFVEFHGIRKNHCSKTVSYDEDHVVPETKKVIETYKTFCWSLTFTCTKHRFKTVTVNKTVTVHKTKRVFECCPGYEKKNDTCVPMCRLSCGHGECVAPDICLCEPGWREPFCLLECEPNKYGRGCKDNCTCLHEGLCDKETGYCHCPKGYTGDSCQLPCPNDTYGQNCKNICKCENDALCDIIDGTCECTPGYEGRYCETPCKNGTHGEDCEEECICIPENTETCHHIDGKCVCKPGYKGEYCEKECSDFTYGQNCSKECNCMNSYYCDPFNGECYCEPGWMGPTCTEKCPTGQFGENCSFECAECLNVSGVCDPITGYCNCPAGWYGEFCNKECLPGYWGSNCSRTCDCSGSNICCDPVTGKCYLIVACHPGYWGFNCSKECNCDNNHLGCDPENGKCFLSKNLNIDYDSSYITLYLVLGIALSVVLFVLMVSAVFSKKEMSPLKMKYNYGSFVRLIRIGFVARNTDCKHADSTISNPVYEAPDVVLESEQNGRDFIRGSYSSGVKYFKNNAYDNGLERKQSNIESAAETPPEEIKIQKNELKEQNVRRSQALNDLSAALKELRRCSSRKLDSAHSSTAALEEDFQPEKLDDFNVIENTYEKPAVDVKENIYSESDVHTKENIYDKPVVVKAETHE